MTPKITNPFPSRLDPTILGEETSSTLAYLKRNVIGQDKAADNIVHILQHIKAKLQEEGRPAASILLMGPTGVGKSETVFSLAELLHGSRKNVLVINCGEFSLDHEAAKMLGSPPGYLGHRETPAVLSPQKLAAVTSEKCDIPIVLFDEIEKAAPAMLKILLGILDKGVVTLGDNTKVDFSKSIIFFTSNLGSVELARQHTTSLGLYNEPSLSVDNAASSAIRAGKKKFSPEFWNRLDKVIVFEHLKAPELAKILDLELMKLDARGNGRFSLKLSHAAKALILEQGTSLEYGARELKRTINLLLTKPLSNLLVSGQIPPGREVLVDLGDTGKLEFSLGLEGPMVILAPNFIPDTFPFTSPPPQRKSCTRTSPIGVN